MSTKYICDRCKEQFDIRSYVANVEFPHVFSEMNGHDASDTFHRDICSECVKNLHEWLKYDTINK